MLRTLDVYFCTPIKKRSFKKGKVLNNQAEVAHLVEHDLAKVGVAGSSPVFRSKSPELYVSGFFFHLVKCCPGGGIGRHAGLKIL